MTRPPQVQNISPLNSTGDIITQSQIMKLKNASTPNPKSNRCQRTSYNKALNLPIGEASLATRSAWDILKFDENEAICENLNE